MFGLHILRLVCCHIVGKNVKTQPFTDLVHSADIGLSIGPTENFVHILYSYTTSLWYKENNPADQDEAESC